MKWRLRLEVALVVGLVACHGQVAAVDLQVEVALGKQIYREGRRANGEPLVAVRAGGVRAEGRDAACSHCHRRSGLGGAEGQIVIRPLTVPGFFAGQVNLRRYTRRPGLQLDEPHYTVEAFHRALRDGVASDGRVLDRLMPRYELDTADVRALRAYLADVARQPAPGVGEGEIHFATIVTPDADPAVQATTLEVLGALVDARNAGTRAEARRLRAGVDSSHVDWRRWDLHVWRLAGSADTWPAQLDRLMLEQPVFAVLSGAGGLWQPVHDFCERRELPCLFPNVDLPGRPEPGDYSLYLTRGVLVEAEVMAQHLWRLGWRGPVRMLRIGDPRAEAGSRAFRDAWQALAAAPVTDVELQPGQSLGDALTPWLARDAGAIVLWVDGPRLDALAGLDLPRTVPVLASGTLMGQDVGARAPALADRVAVVWPYALPGADRAGFDRARRWSAVRQLRPSDQRALANTYWAASMASEAVMHLANNYSREYLIERIEHNADKSLTSGAFPAVGLGPGQRYASKGAYVARFDGVTLVAGPDDWIVP